MIIRLMSIDLKRRIGARIRDARQARGYTQETVAERVGRTVEAISNIERGKTFPNLETLENLARHLDVPLYQIFIDIEAPVSERRFRMEGQLQQLAKSLSDEDLDLAIGQITVLIEHRSTRKPKT